MRIKGIQLAINQALPEELRDYQRPLDAKDISEVLAKVAVQHPDRYVAVSKKLADIGRYSAYDQGVTLRLDDLETPFDKPAIMEAMRLELDQSRKLNTDNEPAFEAAREEIWQKYLGIIQQASTDGAKARGSNLYNSVASGARGNASQLRMMIGAPGLFQDSQDRTVPLFIGNSFSDGLRPGEYMASTYGARKATLSTKRATARGGFFLKQLSQAAAPLIVTEDDCGTTNGIDVDPNNYRQIRGRVLQGSSHGIEAGSILNRQNAAKLRKAKVIIVRSPLTCESGEGICAKCAGTDPYGQFYPLGEAVGATSATGIGEPICLYKDTLVRMADWSERKIKDIKVGEFVLGSDLLGNLTPVKVLNVFHNGLRDCYKTTVKKGKGRESEQVELISTKEHKVLSSHSKKITEPSAIYPIESPGVGYRHHVQMGIGVSLEGGVNRPDAALLGVLIGDGCYNGGVGSAGIAFSCYDPELENWMRELLSGMGLNLRKMTTGEFRVSRVSMVDQYAEFEYVGKKLVRNKVKAILRREGMWGHGSGTKRMPTSIETWDNNSVARLLGGMIATDGWICSSKRGGIHVGLCSNSRVLMESAKSLLEIRFGIYSSRITPKIKKKKEGGSYAPTYNFTVSSRPDVIAISRMIPIPGCKQKKLNDLLIKGEDTRYRRGHFRVVSQVKIGRLDTWDIEVDNSTHLFALANGMIVSNTQNALNVKHLAGVSSAKKQREFSGMNVIEQFTQIPDEFPGRAALALGDGRVESIEDAPQGGKFIVIGEDRHYVDPSSAPTVKVGEYVEKGDTLSDGLADPSEMVDLRGLGEGRRYYSDRLAKILADSGMTPDPLNVEMITRANLNSVRVDDEDRMANGMLPDDEVSYQQAASMYEPPEDARSSPLSSAVGMYLHEPKLHFTIGTRLTPKMVTRMEAAGIKQAMTSPTPAPFTPVMSRLQTSTHGRADWLAQQHTSYLGRQLSDASERGADTQLRGGTHFAPALAVGEGFASQIREKGRF